MLDAPALGHAQSPHTRSIADAENVGEPPAKRRRHGSQNQQRREIGLMRPSDGANAPSFVGSSSGIYFVRSVYHALAKSRAQAPPQTPDQNIVPGEEDQLEEVIPFSSRDLWTPSEVNTSFEEDTRFDFDDMQAWSESYFDNWHTAYPFIHAPTILEYLEQDVRPGALQELRRSNDPKFVIIRSIMSMSLADRRQAGHQPTQLIPANLVFRSFKESMESIQGTLLKPSSMEALQAVVSVQLFLVSMLRLNGASRLGGMIVRMAFQMGLHRCPVRYPGFNTEEAELRRRLFWTIYCIDRHLCQSLGLPLTIRDDDVDVCYFDDELHHLEHRRRGDMDDRLRMLNFLVKHASIKGQIMELRNKSIHLRQANKDLATLIGARVDKWANELQCFIEMAGDTDSSGFNNTHRVILSVLQYESVISLNRPLLALDKDTSEYMAALQTCIRASRSVISILTSHLKSQDQQNVWNTALLWPSLTWCVWMSAFILLHAAIEGEIPRPVARKLADQAVKLLKGLALRGSVWPNVCAVAIDDLFTRLLLDSTVTTPQSPSGHVDQMDSGHVGQTPAASANYVQSDRIRTRQSEVRSSVQQANTRCQDPAHQRLSCSTSPSTRFDALHNQTQRFQTEIEQNNSLLDHANNAIGPLPSTFDLQTSIPWLSGPDAAAATSKNIFEQFDIPFWMGDDQYSSLMEFDF